MRQIRLPLPAHAYRFELLLEFVKRITYPARMVVDHDTLWRFTDGQLLSYRQTDDAIVVAGAGLSAENETRIRRTSLHFLGLCRDLTTFYDFAQTDEKLWRAIEPLAGLPIICTESVFEALITLVIEQHITWKTAMRSQRQLMSLFSGGVSVNGQTVYDFPAPSQLAELEPRQLKALKITDRRSALIIDIAQAVCSGQLDLESIRRVDTQVAYDRFMMIAGVGHWTASNVIGRALGQYPFVSQNDVALQAALRQYFFAGEGEKSAAQVVDTLGEYGGFAGLAGHFILLRWVLDRYPSVTA